MSPALKSMKRAGPDGEAIECARVLASLGEVLPVGCHVLLAGRYWAGPPALCARRGVARMAGPARAVPDPGRVTGCRTRCQRARRRARPPAPPAAARGPAAAP